MENELVGDSFWDALNGMLDSHNNGVQYPDILSDLISSVSKKFERKLSKDGLKYTPEQLDEQISDFESFIPGIVDSKMSQKYFGEDLSLAAAKTKEGNNAVRIDLEQRLVPAQQKIHTI